jgi:SpoIID/LytB domain protein
VFSLSFCFLVKITSGYLLGFFYCYSHFFYDGCHFFFCYFVEIFPPDEDGQEAKFNLLLWKEGHLYYTVVFPRSKHRPDCYFAEGSEQMLISPGALDEGKITAINILPAKDYLISVISSEMNATSSLEFLKAHAVVSRSWLFAQIEKRKALSDKNEGFFSFIKTDTEYIRWYDREDHTIFDVCADDHCQRYQGITKASSAAVTEAVRATRGQLLMYERGICDARFSKCCGGASEEFGYCWEDKNYPYLSTIRDAEEEENRPLPDLTKEEEAERWIRTSPVSFCDTHDKKVISQILNNYDQETTDFYRWKVRYSQAELSELIRQNTKSDYGDIIDLIPIQRGKSGRICKLKIVGSLKTLTIGKELEIRRTLSSSHLFSSAFVIDKGELKNGVPEWFLLTGAGWGHGVGLCQIGAAVMGERGYTYDEILLHYYKGADIRRFY